MVAIASGTQLPAVKSPLKGLGGQISETQRQSHPFQMNLLVFQPFEGDLHSFFCSLAGCNGVPEEGEL